MLIGIPEKSRTIYLAFTLRFVAMSIVALYCSILLQLPYTKLVFPSNLPFDQSVPIFCHDADVIRKIVPISI